MIYTYVAAALIGLAVGGTSIWRFQEWRHDAQDKERIETARETERLRARTADKASEKHEIFKERERVVYQTITETVDRIVERPVYRNDCLDADGVRELNAAIAGSSATTGKPTPAVPRLAPGE
jgi:hypothetical protein